jgi:hypothetical protein
MDSMAAEDASRESEYFLSYTPTDPNLCDSPAFVHRQLPPPSNVISVCLYAYLT